MGSFLLTLVASVLVFSAVILIHELGHFITAKLSGIKVNEFALGMGPQLFHFGKGETTYSLRLFPVGGFVSMEGEDEDSPDPRSYFRAPVSRRILVTVAGAVMNLILGFAVLVAVVCMQDAVLSRTVGDFYPDASTQQHGLQVGDTILAVNGRRCFIANDVSYEFARTQQNTADLTVQRDGKKVELKNVVFDTRTDEDGNFAWPGFGDNMRVLQWIISRADDEIGAAETALGYEPNTHDIDMEGLEMSMYDMRRLLSVARHLWLHQCEDAREYYEKIGKVPPELYEELDALEMRLNRGYKVKHE